MQNMRGGFNHISIPQQGLKLTTIGDTKPYICKYKCVKIDWPLTPDPWPNHHVWMQQWVKSSILFILCFFLWTLVTTNSLTANRPAVLWRWLGHVPAAQMQTNVLVFDESLGKCRRAGSSSFVHWFKSKPSKIKLASLRNHWNVCLR